MAKRGQHSTNQSRDNKGRFAQNNMNGYVHPSNDENLEHKPKENQLATPPFASVAFNIKDVKAISDSAFCISNWTAKVVYYALYEDSS